MSRSDHRRRDRPARPGSVLLEAAIRKALTDTESPLSRDQIHEGVSDISTSQQLTTETLAYLVTLGKVLQIGGGTNPTFWLRSRKLPVSRLIQLAPAQPGAA